jgi:O-antigen ligase
MLRAVWLSGSRGGVAASLATFLPLGLFLPRRRIGAVISGGVIALAVVAVIQGDLLNSPKLQRFLTLSHFESTETYRWRQEQWAIFMDRIKESPLTGVGSDVDRSLAEMDRAQTPHNVYLAVAMRSGVVGLGLTLILLAAVSLACMRGLFHPGSHPEARVLWMGLLGGIVGLCVHGIGEATILLTQVLFLFWTILGFAMVEAAGSSSMRAPGWRTAGPPRSVHG